MRGEGEGWVIKIPFSILESEVLRFEKKYKKSECAS